MFMLRDESYRDNVFSAYYLIFQSIITIHFSLYIFRFVKYVSLY